MDSINLAILAEIVLPEIDGNQNQENGRGGHIEYRIAPIFESSLPLLAPNMQSKMDSIGQAILREIDGNQNQENSRGGHIKYRISAIFERNLPILTPNIYTKNGFHQPSHSRRNRRKPKVYGRTTDGRRTDMAIT